jgi:Na+-transporting NADH:ubiquinone oxidoreductase subunit NqrE
MHTFDQGNIVADMSSDILPMVTSDMTLTSIPTEIGLGKTVNINLGISTSQNKQLVHLLLEHNEAFAWEYTYKKYIHLDLCTNHIYIREYSRPVK